MISLMTCFCSIVRLTVSAGFTAGAVAGAGAGTWASTGNASIRIAAVMPTKQADVIRLRSDMLASAMGTQVNAPLSARFPAGQGKGRDRRPRPLQHQAAS